MNARAYTHAGRTRRVRGIPAPLTNLRLARDFARKWLERVHSEVDNGFGRGVVPVSVVLGGARLVRWAVLRSGQ